MALHVRISWLTVGVAEEGAYEKKNILVGSLDPKNIRKLLPLLAQRDHSRRFYLSVEGFQWELPTRPAPPRHVLAPAVFIAVL